MELFIDEIGWLIDDLGLVLLVLDLGPLGLDEDIYNARDLCTSYASENTDYLTYPLSFDRVKDEASHLLVSVYASIKP